VKGYLPRRRLRQGAVDIEEDTPNPRKRSELWLHWPRHRFIGLGHAFSKQLLEIFWQLITDGAGSIMIGSHAAIYYGETRP
jgi:hypothetical protein